MQLYVFFLLSCMVFSTECANRFKSKDDMTRDFFYRHVLPEQKQMIILLKSISDEIQSLAFYEHTGIVSYSILGIAGGLVAFTTPLTGGGSILIYSGSAAMAGSFFAKLVHRRANDIIVENKLTYANETLSLYKQTCEHFFRRLMIDEKLFQEYIDYLKALKVDDKSKRIQIDYFLSFLDFMNATPTEIKKKFFEPISHKKLINVISSLKQWLHTVLPMTKETLAVLDKAKIVAMNLDKLHFVCIELADLIASVNQLQAFSGNRKCVDSTRLDGLVANIERQFENIEQLFE